MPGAKCKICVSQQRADAEWAIAEGDSVRAVAKRMGLPYSSLDRHQRNCVPKAIARVRSKTVQQQDAHVAAVDQQAMARNEELSTQMVGRVERLQTITDSIIEGAMAGMPLRRKDGTPLMDPADPDKPLLIADSVLALKAIAQARKNLELIGRLTGTLEPTDDKGDGLITFESFEVLYRRVKQGRS